jgi:hypothetical protein
VPGLGLCPTPLSWLTAFPTAKCLPRQTALGAAADDVLLRQTALAAAADYVLLRQTALAVTAADDVLLLQTALAAAAADSLAATGSGSHSKPQFRLFSSAWTEWGHLANSQLTWNRNWDSFSYSQEPVVVYSQPYTLRTPMRV